ncbi:MAG: hypothetical protein K8T20_12350 [Planctomycetes bacterium]|nr:hypothetical protein [Planctomycetota bacterium]
MPAPTIFNGFLGSARIAARQFLNGPRKWVILLAGGLLPGLLALFVFGAKEAYIHPFLQLIDGLYLQGLGLFIALLGAIPGFSSDAEDGTSIYLFSRPTPRWVVVLGKWAGTVVPLTVLMLLPVLAAWPFALMQQQPYETRYSHLVPIPVPKGMEHQPGGYPSVGPHGGQVIILPNGTPAEQVFETHTENPRLPARGRDLFAALVGVTLAALEFGTFFFCIGVFLKYPYIVAIVYTVIVEIIVGATVQMRIHTLSRLVRATAHYCLGEIPPFLASFQEIAPSGLTCTISLIAVPAACLGLACWVISRRAFIGKSV